MLNNIYNDFKDITPYDKVIDDNWSYLWSFLQIDKHPIAYLIIHRFSDRYHGKLTWKEINSIKEKMTQSKERLENYLTKNHEKLLNLMESIDEQHELHFSDHLCIKKLDEHLEKCDKCTRYVSSQECQLKENEWCSHQYEIKHLGEELGKYRCSIDSYENDFLKLNSNYERALCEKNK